MKESFLKDLQNQIIAKEDLIVLFEEINLTEKFIFKNISIPLSEKLKGTSYLEILARGGGILSTVRKTRDALNNDWKNLKEECLKRLKMALALGTTTIEIKSGYGLDLKSERIEFCPELTAKIAKRGIKIHEVPISYYPRHKDEGKKITLQQGFDASAVRLTGNIVGSAPFTGTLIHKGWQVTNIRLPKLTQGHNAAIIAAAEVEL